MWGEESINIGEIWNLCLCIWAREELRSSVSEWGAVYSIVKSFIFLISTFAIRTNQAHHPSEKTLQFWRQRLAAIKTGSHLEDWRTSSPGVKMDKDWGCLCDTRDSKHLSSLDQHITACIDSWDRVTSTGWWTVKSWKPWIAWESMLKKSPSNRPARTLLPDACQHFGNQVPSFHFAYWVSKRLYRSLEPSIILQRMVNIHMKS
jgi:hypothetical protein